MFTCPSREWVATRMFRADTSSTAFLQASRRCELNNLAARRWRDRSTYMARWRASTRRFRELKYRSMRKLSLFAVLTTGLCLWVQAKPLCIVVAGDCRADYPWNTKRPGDGQGINQHTINDIAEAISKDPAEPQIMLWTGDIVNVSECTT